MDSDTEALPRSQELLAAHEKITYSPIYHFSVPLLILRLNTGLNHTRSNTIIRDIPLSRDGLVDSPLSPSLMSKDGN